MKKFQKRHVQNVTNQLLADIRAKLQEAMLSIPPDLRGALANSIHMQASRLVIDEFGQACDLPTPVSTLATWKTLPLAHLYTLWNELESIPLDEEGRLTRPFDGLSSRSYKAGIVNMFEPRHEHFHRHEVEQGIYRNEDGQLTLAADRYVAADGELGVYALEKGTRIETRNGFESSGDELQCVLYVKTTDTTPDQDTLKYTFKVEFQEKSSVVASATMYDEKGNPVGKQAAPETVEEMAFDIQLRAVARVRVDPTHSFEDAVQAGIEELQTIDAVELNFPHGDTVITEVSLQAYSMQPFQFGAKKQ